MNNVEDQIRKKINRLLSSAIDFMKHGDMFNIVPFIIIVFDKKTGELVKVNDNFLKYTCYKEDEVLGKSFFDFIADYDLQRTLENYEEFQSVSCGSNIFRNDYKVKNGKPKPIYWIKSVNADKIIGEYSFGIGLTKINLYDGS